MDTNTHKRIEEHGNKLLKLFPEAQERDPVKLCKKLRRIENKAHAEAVEACNGETVAEDWADKHADKVNTLLNCDRVWVNRDPRGYALKIDLEQGESLYQDWGGYGIIAPDLNE